jgi:sec-independent protein translocase protein TatB
MFDSIGIGELAVICIVFILAVGPEKLPTMMKTVGKTLRQLRQASRDIRASTGIDELMRDDILDAPPVRRQYVPPPGPEMVSRLPTSTDRSIADAANAAADAAAMHAGYAPPTAAGLAVSSASAPSTGTPGVEAAITAGTPQAKPTDPS